MLQKVLLFTKYKKIGKVYPHLFYSNLRGTSHEQKRSLINHEIISVIAAELSTLMPVLGTDKFNFESYFNIIWLIRQRFLCK